jgi:hypothetical protein
MWDIAEEKRVDVLRGMHGMGIPNGEAQGDM